ncbi:MAG: DUF4924 family protein [Bacteroidaceae bacterium]|nr:DUF4924 family protein [Bacteroidaceae bacterium]
MFISQQLRQKSIAEYLLYMWQVEDIIRAYGCSLTELRKSYISQFQIDDDKREELTDWYGNLVNMMNREGCREKGHLQINKVVLMQLIELHNRLLDSSKFPFYRSEYYRVLPFIVELRRKRGMSNEENEVETCFNALYGRIMLGLKKQEISKETEGAIKEISTLVGMLADYYHKDKIEPIFDEDM